MELQEIARWIFGSFVSFAGTLAIGKLLVERDEARGYRNVYFSKKKKRSNWFANHVVKSKLANENTIEKK